MTGRSDRFLMGLAVIAFALSCLYGCQTAFAQGVAYNDIALRNDNGIAKPIPGASIRVCGSTGTGTPCTPIVKVYTTQSLTTSKTNPFTADANGNFTFYVAPGRYVVQVSAVGTPAITLAVTVTADPNNPSFASVTSANCGSATATAGTIRLCSSDTFQFRNQAGTANVKGLSKDSSDAVQVGDTAGAKVAGPFQTGTNYTESIENAAPANPVATKWRWYTKPTAGPCVRNSTGTETCISTGTAGGLIGAGASGTVVRYTGGGGTLNLASYQRTTNVDTFITTVAHGYSTGDTVTISNCTTLSSFNGTYTITVVNATTFSTTQVAGDSALVAGEGNATKATTTTGPGSLQDDGVKKATAKVLNEVRYADRFTGADAAAKITAAIADLPATGGVVDARGFGATTQTWGSAVVLGSFTKPISLLVDCATKFNITINNAATNVITEPPASAIQGSGCFRVSGSTGGFVLAATASVKSVIFTDNTDSSLSRAVIKGISVVAVAGATVAKGLVYLLNSTDSSVIQDSTIVSESTGVPTALLITETPNPSTVGPVDLINLTISCLGNANCTPVTIQGPAAPGGVMYSINFFGGSIGHPGTGKNVIDIIGVAAAEIAGVNFFGTQIEAWDNTNDGINIVNATGINIYSLFATSHSTVGTNLIKLSGTTQGVTITSLYNFQGWTNAINSNTATDVSTIADTIVSMWTDKPNSAGLVSMSHIIPVTREYTAATLPIFPNGSIIYCSDCKSVTNGAAAGAACAAGGTGAHARRQAGGWFCN